MPAQFRLPDTLANWPWPRVVNPHYEEVKAESSAWLRSFNAFSPNSQRAFDLCDFNLLASLAYPNLSKERLRTGCDLMNLFFVIDEYTDVGDEATARKYTDIVMDALHNPYKPRPAGESVVGEIARQFWERGTATASKTARRRFVEKFAEYLDSVIQQAADRGNGYMRTVDEYFLVRRSTIGAEPSYALLELAMDLPDEVFNHPVLVELSRITTDLLILGNDICSYNKEQSEGDTLHNVVSIAMHQMKLDLDAVLLWLGRLHDDLVEQFFARYEELKNIPWGAAVQEDVATYIDGLGNWVRANDSWSFESGRYFGKDGRDIQAYRIVDLKPPMA